MSQQSVESNRLLLLPDLAEVLSLGESTLRRYMAEGKLPRPIRLGRTHRWNRTEIQAWIEAGCPDQVTWERTKRLRS